ncbi:MAG: glucosyltransferase domain-containing protein [Fibromonadales bacterium]|nr:glucosyltransferase domain-containing protein [Fibromonadales bacterium]
MKLFSEVNFKSFCDFCKNNIPLLVIVTAALFFCYGMKLFQYSIGIDTELFMSDKADILEWSLQIGRFGLACIQWLLYTKGFNPFIAFLGTFCLIWLFTISWAYMIAIFSNNIEKNNALIFFALILITSPIWIEQFYFLHQSTAVALMVLICPYTIYFLFKGFLDNEKNKVIVAFLLIILMTSVYQAMVPFFCCGVFICFIILLKTSDLKPPIYRNLCLKLLATSIAAITAYFIIDRILIHFIFDIEKAQYLDNINQWGQRPIKENILRIFGFIGIISGLIIPQLQDTMNVLIPNTKSIKIMINKSNVFGNILLLPTIIFFMIMVIKTRRNFLYILAGIFIPLSVMFLAILGGNILPMRTMYVLPLAFAFMFFFLINTSSKKTAIVIIVFAIFTTIYQAQTTAQLLYSDQLRYNEDVRLAYEIRDSVINSENLPVAIIGKYNVADKFHANFLKGDVIGHSFFEWGDYHELTNRSLDFMRTLGIQLACPSDEQFEKAKLEAHSMPSYPNSGFVRKLSDVIVIKLSE